MPPQAEVLKERKKTHAATPVPNLDDPDLYINRELGLLAFQWRVLEEARDITNPLLERAKFLSIVGSNLDEFFMVRVASLTAQKDAGILEFGPDRMSPSAQLLAIRREVKRLNEAALQCLEGEVIPALGEAGIEILAYSELSPKQMDTARKYFSEVVFPVLTPLAFDPGRPFPHISNLSLNLAVSIRDARGEERFARVKVPDSLPALVPLTKPRANRSKKKRAPWQKQSYVWIEDVIAANLNALFPGMEVIEAHPFHVTRDADIAIKELEAEDLLETIEEGVRQRKFGSVVRLQVHRKMPQPILNILMTNLEVHAGEVYRNDGLLGLSRLAALAQIDRPDLKYQPILPSIPPELKPSEDEDIFSIIRRGDVLLHHPYQSFQPVVDFLRKAARDPDVLAIKMVLYRVGRNSPVVEALLEAIEEGKQVAVLMELKARFDEESNIEWAKALERSGVHVVYGLVGLKIHCKAAIVLRREDDAIRPYLHLATGNYNVVTAHVYTDIGMFTTNPELAGDAIDVFNYLTGYSAKRDYGKLLMAPVNLRERFEALVKREIKQHETSGKGHIVFKMNALVDPGMIQLLYRASQAGVKVDLLVRGICCLRPGVPGVSDNIRVTSIVGRFLEHSRIFYFRNGGKEEIYLGSADLMPRNLNRRVELLFPVQSSELLERLRDEILGVYLLDNVKSRRMLPDGTYKRPARVAGDKSWNSQEILLGKANGKHRKTKLVW